MGRKISPLNTLEESLAKKKAIEEILINAKVLASTDAASWLPKRRYLQKVLWGLSVAELKKWTSVDTAAILSKLEGKDPKSKQIAKLEEMVEALGFAATTISGDKEYKEKAYQAIAEAREIK